MKPPAIVGGFFVLPDPKEGNAFGSAAIKPQVLRLRN
jgi:hypothetical protein